MLQLDERTQQLLKHLWRGGKWGYFWTLDRATSRKTTHWLPIDKANAAPNGAKLDTYFGVNPTLEAKKSHERALLTDVCAVNCLFSEFDGKDFASKDDALRYVESIQPEPSVIIDSGGGYHLYWLLRDTFEIRNDQERQYIRDVLARWVDFVRGDVVKDLARVLRVPGTYNYKPDYGPKAPLVEFVAFDAERQYNLAQLVALLPPPEEPRTVVKPQATLSLTDGELVNKIKASKQGAKFISLFERGEIIGYKSHSEADAALCQILIGWAQGDIQQADRLFRQSALFRPKWDNQRNGATYGAMTLNFALDHATWFYDPHPQPQASPILTPPEEPPWEFPEEAPPTRADEVYTPRTEQPKVEPAGWRWLTLSDAYSERPPREYIIEKLLPVPSLTAMYGAPGGLKTMLVLDMVMAVLSGEPFLDPLPGMDRVSPFNTQPCGVMWVDVDNGERRSLDRMKALGKARNIPEEAPFYFVSFPTPPFVASNQDSVDFLIENAALGEVKLIIFDNLGTISGGADENSAQMVEVMSGLRKIAERANCAVVVIHHRNKGSALGNNARKGNALRGHSSIEGALDLALLIEREEGEDVITIESTKTRDIPVWPFEAMWTYTQDAAGELISGRFYGLGRPEKDDESKPANERAYEYILISMSDTLSQTDIVTQCKDAKIGRNATLTALEQLERDKLVEVDRGERNTKIYRLSALGRVKQREILYNK